MTLPAHMFVSRLSRLLCNVEKSGCVGCAARPTRGRAAVLAAIGDSSPNYLNYSPSNGKSLLYFHSKMAPVYAYASLSKVSSQNLLHSGITTLLIQLCVSQRVSSDSHLSKQYSCPSLSVVEFFHGLSQAPSQAFFPIFPSHPCSNSPMPLLSYSNLSSSPNMHTKQRPFPRSTPRSPKPKTNPLPSRIRLPVIRRSRFWYYFRL